MSTTKPASVAAEASTSRSQPSVRAVDTAYGWCLVASGDREVRRQLTAAAEGGGWQVRACGTPHEALREAVLHRTPLALVDVGSVQDRASHADLIRLVRDASEGLVVVCDRAANADGELWARQEGAWVYLPGVGKSEDIASLCRQARRLTDRKHAGSRPEFAV